MVVARGDASCAVCEPFYRYMEPRSHRLKCAVLTPTLQISHCQLLPACACELYRASLPQLDSIAERRGTVRLTIS